MMRRPFVFLAASLLLALPLLAQNKGLTLEAIYDPEKRLDFSGAAPAGFQWVDETTFVWPATDWKGEFVEWRLFETKRGTRRPLFERARAAQALERAGLSSEEAKKAAETRSLAFDRGRSAFVVVAADDLFLYSIGDDRATRLTSNPEKEEESQFSPDGRLIAFVRNHDLHVVDRSGRERRLTTDGDSNILNGKLDWVYQEEIYGRGTFRAFWWSPDSTRLAYLRLDETQVPEYTIVDDIPYRQRLDVYRYPKAGDPNPLVQLRMVSANGGAPVVVDIERYADAGILIVNVAWSPDAKQLTFQVQNREQTWLELAAADAKGTSRALLRETSDAWVERLDNPRWLADGSFLWQSERTGWRHIEHYDAGGRLLRPVTQGEWEVRALHGVDEKSGWVYFSGTERSPIGLDVYRVKLDGTGLERVSAQKGTHGAVFNEAATQYVDRWSDVRTPFQVRAHRSDGRILHVVDENRVPARAEHALPEAEFLQVKTRDGFEMEAMLIKPRDFDPEKKYPVYHSLYGGPHAPRVRDAWGGQRALFEALVAEQGVLVWLCDNRTASGKGAVSTRQVYRRFGELELRDVEDGIAWLKEQPFVDGERIMLNGWSYGGFMVTYAMTHSTSFRAGIAGGSVTDWRDYDSIYTERYMGTPQNNPDGYRASSPRFAAKELHGNLLLIHGAIDDNVHVQNTMQFAWELQNAGKSFEMMLYPKSKHGITDRALLFHMQKTMLGFVRRNLLESDSRTPDELADRGLYPGTATDVVPSSATFETCATSL